MALITAGFENEYNQVHAHTSQLLNAERDRAHCIEQLLLRIENESLQLQVHQTEKELIQARETESNTRLQLGSALRELDSLQDISQASLREIENLRVCAHVFLRDNLTSNIVSSMNLHYRTQLLVIPRNYKQKKFAYLKKCQ